MTKKLKNYQKPSLVTRIFHRINVFISSRAFFGVILVLFVLQALFMAWTGKFSMAYDEFFHLAAIQEYAKGWLPVVSQPAGPATLGALEADPSYLYYYLMSFPYRLIVQIWESFAAQIVALRVINVAIFAIGIVFYWRTLIRAGLSLRSTNVIMLFFALIPTFVMLAGQLNYDNLMFLASGVAMYLATDIVVRLRTERKFSLNRFVILVAVLLAGSVVKYAMLPLAGAIGLFVLVEIGLALRRKKIDGQKVWSAYVKNLSRPAVWLSVLFLVASVGLFFGRTGMNVVRYGALVPDCAQVLSYEQCMGNDVYARNDKYKQGDYKSGVTVQKALKYPKRWYEQMIKETYFVVAQKHTNYLARYPLPTAWWFGKIATPIMLLTVGLFSVWLWRQNAVWRLFLVASGAYVGTLFARNFSEYLQLGVPVAIHGRYVVFIIPLVAALMVEVSRRWVPRNYRPWLAVLAVGLLLLLLGGGGVLPWVIRSADEWQWDHAVEVVRSLRSFLWPFIIRGGSGL